MLNTSNRLSKINTLLKLSFWILSMCVITIFSNLALANDNVVWINNIKHSRTEKTIHLSWDATSGNNQADMFLWTNESNTFKYITTIDTFKKSTTLQIKDNGTYVVRFIPTGGGNDIRYTFSVTGVNTQQKDIPTVPKTGTTSNILIILGFSILLYTLYRYRKVSKQY